MTVFFLLISLLSAEPEFSCRWGEKSELQPLPDCGVPVRVRIKFPEETKGRFEFRRLENPGLTGYFHMKRDGQGSPKPFANQVNLFKVDLFFCPSDFVTPRSLLFHHVGIPAAKDYQCQLGPYSDADGPGGDAPAMAAEKPQPPAMTAEMAASEPGSAEKPVNTVPPKDAVTGLIPPPGVTSTGRDDFARNLAAAALAVAVLSLLCWGVFAVRVSRSLRRRREEDAPVVELKKSDRKPDDEG